MKIFISALTLILSLNHLKADFHCDEWSKDKETCLKCDGNVCADIKHDCTTKCICNLCESSAVKPCGYGCLFGEEEESENTD